MKPETIEVIALILTCALFFIIILQVFLSSLKLFRILSKKGEKVDWFSAKRIFASMAIEVFQRGFPAKNEGIAKLSIRFFLELASLWRYKINDYNITTGFDLYVERNGLTYNFNSLFVKLVLHPALKDKVQIFHEGIYLSEKETITTIIFPNKDVLFLKNKSDLTFGRIKETYEKEVLDKWDHFGAFSKGFDMATQMKLIWDTFPSGILFDSDSNKNVMVLQSNYERKENKSTVDKLPKVKFEELDPVHPLYVCSASLSVEKFSRKIQQFKDAGMQKNYLFVGEPGTGKTVFGRQLARAVDKGCLVISAGFFKDFDLGMAHALQMIEEIAPAFIICDDFDRAFNGDVSSNMLLFFERMKQNPKFKETVLIATVNQLEKLTAALIRPGRFDEIIEFELPGDLERVRLINAFFGERGYTASPEHVQEIVEATSGFSQAYIKEFAHKLIIENNFQELMEHIKITRRLIALKTIIPVAPVVADLNLKASDTILTKEEAEKKKVNRESWQKQFPDMDLD